MYTNPDVFLFDTSDYGKFVFDNVWPNEFSANDHFNKHVHCRNGAVVSAYPLASMARIQMLKQGGNAVDAAIATQLALAVVYPGAGNIRRRRVHGCPAGQWFQHNHRFSGKSSAGANRNMYLDAKENVIPGKSENGHLAARLPGSVAGIFRYYKFARLPFQ